MDKGKIISIVILFVIMAVGGYLMFQYVIEIKNADSTKEKLVACTMDAKMCPDGSYVGRIAPDCSFAPCSEVKSIKYINNDYRFELDIIDSWKDYAVEINSWNGWLVGNYPASDNYIGPLIIIKNPKTTAEEKYQDIPIMVFTPDVWVLVQDEKLAVSAAPIGPNKIGENDKYIFATPPRWYGFTGELGVEEALQTLQTFKVL